MCINMKQLLFLLLVFCGVSAGAQSVDSTQLLDTFVLKREYVSYIKGVVGSDGDAATFKFNKQVSNQVTANYDSTQLITMIVPAWYTLQIYKRVSSIDEGVGGLINNDIAAALLPQIKNPWLINQLLAFKQQLQARKAQLIEQGDAYFQSLKD